MSHQTLLDDEFQEVVTGHRHFWSQWLHGNKRNQAQANAADAAAARAEAAELSVQNSFDVLGEPLGMQVGALMQMLAWSDDVSWLQQWCMMIAQCERSDIACSTCCVRLLLLSAYRISLSVCPDVIIQLALRQ